jgi:protease secretion system membrane fusion protein
MSEALIGSSRDTRTSEGFVSQLKNWTNSFNPYVPDHLERDGVKPVLIEESKIKGHAGILVAVTFGIFLIWSVSAPLDSGAVVTGSVVVQGSRKAVQHPTGGVVEEILVREGSVVRQGDIIIKINPLNIDANLRQAEYEFINALAAYSRLMAEATDKAEIVWDPELANFGANPQVEVARRLQTAMFMSKRSEHLGQRSILAQQGEGLRQQLREKENVYKLRGSQLAPIAQDAENLRKLAGDGFVPRSKANEAERSSVEAQANLATLMSDIASARTAVASNELELNKLRAAYTKGVDTELTETQKTKETLRSRVLSLRFDKSLVELKAPASGTVVGMKVNTVGGVITAGQVLLEIVPRETSLIVEAAVPPHVIDKVSVGMDADLRFSAFNSLTTPVIPGVVRLVGADRLPPQPPRFTEEYFLAQVEPTAEGLKLLRGNDIVPGMPVEVVVKNGERTFMSYFLKPLTDRFARSFKD